MESIPTGFLFDGLQSEGKSSVSGTCADTCAGQSVSHSNPYSEHVSAFNAGVEFFFAMESIGVQSLTDDECCRLLAWLHHERGSNESVVHNFRLYKDIRIAQKRLNLFGGKCPNVNLLTQFQECCRQTETEIPDWFTEIETKYGLSSRLSSRDRDYKND
jgi:hypothetical protein